MANGIEMVNDALNLGRNSESTVQSGGSSAGIEMYGGSEVSLKETPISSAQTGKGSGSVDWVGETGLLNHTPQSLYGEKFPSDKGE